MIMVWQYNGMEGDGKEEYLPVQLKKKYIYRKFIVRNRCFL